MVCVETHQCRGSAAKISDMRNFETKDFTGCGQYLVRNRFAPNACKDTGYMETLMVKVGFTNSARALADSGRRPLCLVDMSDGLTRLGYFDTTADPEYKTNGKANTDLWVWHDFDDFPALCEYLNNPAHCEEYRFATHEEVMRVVLGQRGRCRG